MCPPFTGATISDGGLEPNRAKVKSEENCASFYAFSIDTISVDVGMRPGHIGCTTGKASDWQLETDPANVASEKFSAPFCVPLDTIFSRGNGAWRLVPLATPVTGFPLINARTQSRDTIIFFLDEIPVVVPDTWRCHCFLRSLYNA